ncbi:MAG TPA: carboxypeptidase-like regulatory domain-containing protein [Terriglobia bacterium]|nr:carboxypeptidase-like regulatory domain-containing protein [Terriglobia bacterium]
MKGRSGIFRSVLFSVSLVLGVLISSPLLAQVDMGSIQGTVLDQSGAVIPNANVTLTNEATNLTVQTKSNNSGAYIFTPIRIGTYTVTAETPGFAKVVQAHLTLNVQQQLVVNLTLRPGAVTQTIEVTGAPPALQTQNASVGQVVDSRSVNNLPLNGRNFTFLAQIVAGVNTPQADTRGNAASGAFSANGERPAQNDYLLDGIDNNSNTIDFLNGTNYVVLPPIDAVQEFKVQTSNYSAEIGRAGGAVLNATIKSGSNQLHGDVWEFLRNDKLDAADFFEDSGGIKKGEYRQNQFGFTLGGPIVIPHVFNGRDKLFFFGDFEALRRVQGSVFTNSVPTDLERSSGFSNLAELITDQAGNSASTDSLGRNVAFGTVLDPATTRPVTCGSVDTVTGLTPPGANKGDPCFQTAPGTQIGYVADPFYTGGSVAGIRDFTSFCPNVQNCRLNQIPAGRIDPNAIKILNLFPTAQLPGIVSNQTTNPPLTETRDAFDGRIDWNLSNKDQIFSRASFVNDPEFIPSPFQGVADGGAFQEGPQTALSIQVALGWTHTLTPTSVNEARVGETYLHTTRFGPVADQMGIPAQYGIQDVPQVPENGGLPAIIISGLSSLGSNAFLPSDEVSQTTQVADNFTKVYGKHTYKMGFEFQHIKFATLQPSWSHGEFDYNGDFVGGGNNGIAQILLSPVPSTVPNGVDNLGGASSVYTSNIALVDDLHNYYSAYFNDDWKLAKKLTLNFGLRWEHFGLPLENHGRQANFVPGTPFQGAEYLVPDSEINRNLFGTTTSFNSVLAQDGIDLKFDKNWALGDSQNLNFAPRFGFAYQVTPKLVARGGFGVFFGGFEVQNGNNQGNSFPYQFNFQFFIPDSHTPITVSGVNAPGCDTAYTFELGFSCTPLDPSLVPGSNVGLTGLQHNFQTPYTEGWNMTFEYAFTPTLTLTAGYVGNSTHHLEIFRGTDHVSQILAPDATSCGPGAPVPFPDFGCNQTYQTTDGSSYYNGLQTTLEKRFSGGLNFLTTYTYSRCRSDAADLLNGTAIGSYRAVDVPGAGIQADYGDCDFDIRHVFHFSGGYDLPFGKGRQFMNNANRGVDLFLGGWSTQWLAAVQGGQPITLGCDTTTAAGVGCYDYIVPGVDRHGSGAPDHFLNPAAFTQPCPPPGFTQPSRCVSGVSGLGLLGGTASQVSGPRITTWDFSVFKNIPLTERFHLQFRSEFFNILNHPTFNAPGFGGNGVRSVPGSTDFLNANFGQISTTRFPFKDPRQIQFALKLYF